MKSLFFCRTVKKKTGFPPGQASGYLFSLRRLPASSIFQFINLNNQSLMRSLINAVRKIAEARRLAGCCLLLLTTMFVNAQQKTITGTVKNAEDDAPLVNATVLVKGTAIGTTTNEKGVYTIKANTGQVLLVSAIGFSSKEEKITNRETINFLLANSSTELTGVVVTALGIKREEKALGYATTTVKGEDLTNALSSNWTDALSGKVAGLNLVRSNGGPTGSNRIILRGENNLMGGDEALIVVDGVIINQGSGRRTGIGGETVYGTGSDNMPADYGSSLNDINPEDIETVTVLKGPGAAALYGERAANGAIIITTKSGGVKKKGIGITFTSNASIEQVNRWPDLHF
jgi:TonB-dependent SusC/RagA subfamily outer membrane receptor